MVEKRRRKKKPKHLKIPESYKGSQDLWMQDPREPGRAESITLGIAFLPRHLQIFKNFIGPIGVALVHEII